jgi:hypothetical protein
MLLSEFVSSSINQIIDGVAQAQKYASDKGAKVNSYGTAITKVTEGSVYHISTNELGQLIEFDVAVTTTEGNGSKVGLGISIASIGLGGQIKSDISNTLVSRLKFSIPIFLPKQS